MLNQYLMSHWRDGARGEIEGGIVYYDCWGLVRAVRHELFGKPLLPSYGHIRRTDAREFTQAYVREAEQLTPCHPVEGAIASAFRSGICTHVAVVVRIDHRWAVLETNPNKNASWAWLSDFTHRYMRVTFHD